MNPYRKFLQEVASAGLPSEPGAVETFSSAQLASLPEPARRYLEFMGVAKRPPDWSFRLGYTGLFRTKPNQRWMRCRAWQYNSAPALARIFHIRIRFGGFLPVLARDTYIRGHGRMLVRLLDWFPIADGNGEEYDLGELVTYLNDAVLIAPSMLCSPKVSWGAAAEDSFDLSLTDQGHTVTGRVTIGENGAPTNFTTTDRFCYDPRNPKRLIRAPWSTPVGQWQTLEGRPLPSSAQAVWDLPQGPFAYADFRILPGSLAFNARPGE